MRLMEGFRFRVERSIRALSVRFWLFRPGNDSGVYVALPLTIERRENPRSYTEPFLELPEEAGQSLIDELYRAGYRPSEADSPGELSAVRAHLDHVSGHFDALMSLGEELLRSITDPSGGNSE